MEVKKEKLLHQVQAHSAVVKELKLIYSHSN